MEIDLAGKLIFIFTSSSTNLSRASRDIGETRIMVNLDEEKARKTGRPLRSDHESEKVYCVIRRSKVIRMAMIKAYLTRQIPFDNSVLEAISKLPPHVCPIITDDFQASWIMPCASNLPGSTP